MVARNKLISQVGLPAAARQLATEAMTSGRSTLRVYDATRAQRTRQADGAEDLRKKADLVRANQAAHGKLITTLEALAAGLEDRESTPATIERLTGELNQARAALSVVLQTSLA